MIYRAVSHAAEIPSRRQHLGCWVLFGLLWVCIQVLAERGLAGTGTDGCLREWEGDPKSQKTNSFATGIYRVSSLGVYKYGNMSKVVGGGDDLELHFSSICGVSMTPKEREPAVAEVGATTHSKDTSARNTHPLYHSS